MKASHRKDVIIARIIFAILCVVLLAGIIALGVWLHGKFASQKPQETQITNNAPPADNSNLPPVTEQVEDNVWTSTDGLNLREEPNTDCKILVVLETGTKLTLLDEDTDGWAHVSYEGQEGYVSAEYITNVDPAEDATQEVE